MLKKLLLLVSLFIFLCSNLFAQTKKETVYLRNGGIIKGEILEQIPDSVVKIKTADGSIFVYKMSEIEKITKEAVNPSIKEGRHRGLDFNIDAGYNIATKGGGGNVSAEIGLGKRFNKNFYWGIGSGAYIPTGDGDPSFPLTSDFKLYFPLKSTSLTPGGIVRVGYVFNTTGDITIGTGKHKTTIEVPDNIMIQIMPTLGIPLSKRVDFNLGVGYTHFIPTKGGDGGGAFSIRTGFGFHKSPIRKPKKPKKPTRDKGIQATIEGGKMNFGSDEYNGWTSALVFTYKMNPNISLGIGASVDIVNTSKDDALRRTIARFENGKDEMYSESDDIDEDFCTVNLFIRGLYRLTNRRLSPFVACDAGIRFYTLDDYDLYYSNSDREILGEQKEKSFFATPAIGLSLRTTNNSYLELKAGYSLTPKYSRNGEVKHDRESEHYYYNYTSKASLKLKMSAPFVTLGFTHTF